MKQDSSWRKILDALLPEFLNFYFPEIFQAIDFEKGFEFLDKELQKILPKDDDTGKRVVDKLVKVWLRDGSEKWLLIHIEVQGYRETDFPKRVYQCNYRIFDRFGEEVISVALLTDEHYDFRDNIYQIARWGFRLHFEFPVVKLLDYRDKWVELKNDPNPFAIATMAFLKTVETKGNDSERYQWKKRFLMELYRKGMRREMVLSLYEFISVVMALPLAKDRILYEEIKQTTEEKKMSVLTIAERVGKREGRKEGRREGIKEMLCDILEIKFGAAGLQLAKQAKRISSLETLQKIRIGLKQAQSIAEAEALIQASLQKNQGTGSRNK
ncbi:MAG: hypothetical protein ACE5I1_18555 [bacterium]